MSAHNWLPSFRDLFDKTHLQETNGSTGDAPTQTNTSFDARGRKLQRSKIFDSYRHHGGASGPGGALPSINKLFEISSMSSAGGVRRRHGSDRLALDLDDKATSSATQSKRQGYPCERCGRMFGRKADALKHIRVVHDKLKTFACVVCGKRFARKDYCMVRGTHEISHSLRRTQHA